MTRVVGTVGLVLLFLIQIPTSAQQTALTDGMLKASEQTASTAPSSRVATAPGRASQNDGHPQASYLVVES